MSDGQATGLCFGAKNNNFTVILVEKKDNGSGGIYGLPGGRIENGETPEEGFCREWAEEVGNEAEFGPLNFLFIEELARNGSEGGYVQYLFRIAENYAKLRDCGTSETGPPKRITFRDIFSGKIKVLPWHLGVMLLGLQKINPKSDEIEDPVEFSLLKIRLADFVKFLREQREEEREQIKKEERRRSYGRR